MKMSVLWITRTAMFTALLIVMQTATAPLGNTLITGTIVNLILVVSVMVCGFTSGATVAAISPVFAKLVGIGPLWSLIPFIIAGNIVLIVIWNYLGNADYGNSYGSYAAATIAAAAAKSLVLYVGIARVAVPFILNLPEPQASVISTTFSFPQFITALAGGALASAVLPVIKKAIKA